MTKEFEKAFISCCLKKPTLVPTMLSGIKADMFDNGECKIIWTIMSELSDKTHKVDVSLFPTMIVGELTKKGLADYVSETTMLSLLKMDVNPKNIATYSKPMRDRYKRNALQQFTNEMSKCLKENCDFATIKKIYQKLSIIDSNDDISQPQSLVEIIDNNISTILDQDKTKTNIWQSGMNKLDNYMRFMSGNLYCIGGRPGSGKTTLARALIYSMAYRMQYKILFFSLEMGKEEIEIGFTCSRHSISFSEYIKKTDDEKIAYKNDFRQHLVSKNIDITIDDETMDCDAIINHIIRINDEKGLDIVFIDYLQLMGINGMRLEEGASENILITVIMKKLKACAKHIRKPIVVLSQLSRKVEERENKIPLLSDLRSSGSIEQDCTGIIFVYRDEYYKGNRTPEAKKGKIDLIIGKNRWGKVGSLEFNFKGEYGQVYE